MSDVIPERADALPEIANDPGHPLRPFVFTWMDTGHGDARTWYSFTAREEFHGIERIVRIPRARPMAGLKKRKDELVVTEKVAHYHFDDDGAGGAPPEGDGPFGGLTHEEMEAELKRRHGPYVNDLEAHPLVQAWRRGEEIEWEPAPAPFPVGAVVRRHMRDMQDEHPEHAARVRSRQYEVLQAHALYSRVSTRRGPDWIANRLLELVPEAELVVTETP